MTAVTFPVTRELPPFGQYQIILLGDRSTRATLIMKWNQTRLVRLFSHATQRIPADSSCFAQAQAPLLTCQNYETEIK